MLAYLKKSIYNRDILIGRSKLRLKNFQCQNITCNKTDEFKKYKENQFICECGYIAEGEFEIEMTIKVKLYCQAGSKCIYGKAKMDRDCLKCEKIGER